MARAREGCEWARASIMMSLAFNAARDKKKSKPLYPKDFNPYHRREAPSVRISIRELKGRFNKPKRKRVREGH